LILEKVEADGNL